MLLILSPSFSIVSRSSGAEEIVLAFLHDIRLGCWLCVVLVVVFFNVVLGSVCSSFSQRSDLNDVIPHKEESAHTHKFERKLKANKSTENGGMEEKMNKRRK